MRNLFCCLVFTIAVFMLITSLSGCAIGVKQRSNEVPPEDDVYYERSAYDSYDAGRRFRGSSNYDSGYDPWTMGTYYQHYSGPSRSSAGSGSSGKSSARNESKRPAVKDRNSISASQSQAPTISSDSNSKKSRTSLRERRKTNSRISDSARRKGANRKESSVSRKNRSSSSMREEQRRTNSQKAQPRETRSTTEEEDEKDKKRRSPR